MKNTKNYTKRTSNRSTAVTTVNLTAAQLEMVKRKNLNLSLLTRDLLDKFFTENFAALYEALKTENEK